MKAFLPEQFRISQVHLRTGRLGKAVAFYTDVLGLKAVRASGSQTVLSATGEGPGLLVLTEDLESQALSPCSTGLYHFAIRYPSRRDLAQAYHRLMLNDYPVAGASDHGVSEAIYLSDPDGNGVELYADRPRAQWRWRDGQVAMMTKPLDLQVLLAGSASESKSVEIPGETDIGHIHLQVGDLAAAERFYREFLGLAVTQRSYPGALFFAAGGYHHHIGVNVWGGKTAPPRNCAGLVSYRVEVPLTEILYCLDHRAPLLGYETRPGPQEEGNPILQIRDPNGHWLEVQASTAATNLGPGRICPGSKGAKHSALLENK